jgi:hypothetical protein
MSGITGTNPFSRFENPTLLANVKDSRLDKTVMQTGLEFFTTKDFPKIFNYVIQWISRFTEISPQVQNFGNLARDVKNFYSVTKIPSGLVDTANAANKLFHSKGSKIGHAFLDFIRKLTAWANDFFDGIKLGLQMKLFSVGRAAPYVDVVSAGFTAVGSLTGLIDDSIKVHNAPTKNEKLLHGLAIGMDISYLLVGILGITGFIIGAPISLVLVPLTTALVCSISYFFFKNLADPEGRNRNAAEVQEALKWKLQPPAIPQPEVPATLEVAVTA